MKLIVGLGNIGADYENTYHNIGFDLVDAIQKKHGFPAFRKKGNAYISRGKINDVEVLLAKPTTFMNLSGVAVKTLKDYYKLDNADICIALDDIDLTQGSVRYRENGSSGTHNGLRSVVMSVGETPRIRVGIGRNTSMDLADYVLSHITRTTRAILDKAVADAITKVEDLFIGE